MLLVFVHGGVSRCALHFCNTCMLGTAVARAEQMRSTHRKACRRSTDFACCVLSPRSVSMMVASALSSSAATNASRAANLSHMSVQKRTIVHVSASLKRGFAVGTEPIIFIFMSLDHVNPIRVVSLNPVLARCAAQRGSHPRNVEKLGLCHTRVFSHTWTRSIALQQHRAVCLSDTTVGTV